MVIIERKCFLLKGLEIKSLENLSFLSKLSVHIMFAWALRARGLVTYRVVLSTSWVKRFFQNEELAKSLVCLKRGLKNVTASLLWTVVGWPVPPAVDTITTYTLPASPPPPAQTLTHAYLAFRTWPATKMGTQASLLWPFIHKHTRLCHNVTDPFCPPHNMPLRPAINTSTDSDKLGPRQR